MVRREKEAKKRGPKYPEGVGKRKILLIALDHTEGIAETNLVDEIKEKLSFSSNRGIKGHLGDLGPGRTVKGKWKEGKQYLMKIPSKFEPKNTKNRLKEILSTQGVEIDINNFPEESTWNTKMDENTFKKIAEEVLRDDEEGVLFIKTSYAKKMFDKYVLPRLNVSTDKNTLIFLKKAVRLSPTALRHILFEVPEVKVGTAMWLSAGKYYINKEPDKVSNIIISLWVSLLIDSIKYQEIKTMIDEFLDDPAITQVLLKWLGPAVKEVDIEEVLSSAAENNRTE